MTPMILLRLAHLRRLDKLNRKGQTSVETILTVMLMVGAAAMFYLYFTAVGIRLDHILGALPR